MKKLFFEFAFLLLFIHVQVNAQDYITVYKDCNFNGASQRLDVGSYIDVQLGIGNDAISSIRVGRGVKVTVFSDNNFQGSSATFYDDQQCFDKTWNDKVSSLRVERTSDSPNYDRHKPHSEGNGGYYNSGDDNMVVMYEDSDFRGKDHVYSCCNNFSSEVPANRISSIKVPEGYSVTVYTGERWTGYSKVIRANVAKLDYQLNDKIKSIKVQRDNGGGNEEYGSEAPPGGFGNNNSGSSDEVRLYRDCDYNGASMSLGKGSYTLSRLSTIGNDKLSSLRVPVGFKVLLYADDNFRGYMTTIYSDQKCLKGDWNDKVSSLIVKGVSD